MSEIIERPIYYTRGKSPIHDQAPAYSNKPPEGPLPEGTIIFNSVMSLVGDFTWWGYFRVGTHYAAVLPDSDQRDAYILENSDRLGNVVKILPDHGEMARTVCARLEQDNPHVLERLTSANGNDPLQWDKKLVIDLFLAWIAPDATEKIEVNHVS